MPSPSRPAEDQSPRNRAAQVTDGVTGGVHSVYLYENPKYGKFVFLTNGPNDPAEFASKVGAKNVNGIFSTGDWFPEEKSPGNAAFVKEYVKAYGGSSSTIDPTAFSPVISTSRICRRCASAMALKTSDVVEARATGSIIFRSRHVSRPHRQPRPAA